MKFDGHLHVHTEYSMLDGMTPIEELIVKAKNMGQTGIAITDHGGSSGLYEAWKLGKKYDFNVLLGEEFYFENDISELKTGHLILIAKNETGLRNIFKLQQLAYDNVYYKPRINMEMLKQYKDGLICTTACIANAVGQLILKDEKILAMNKLLGLKELFGEDFYVELQSTTNAEVHEVNEVLSEWIKDLGLKCIITSDVHYLNHEDYEVHETLLCIQQKAKMSSDKRWKFEYNDYWLKSEDEMIKDARSIPREVLSDCMVGIHEIFEKCKGVEFEIKNHLPEFCETREDEAYQLRLNTMKGYQQKVMARGEGNEGFAKDLEKELAVITEEGYAGYFLVVQEYINWARQNGIPVGDGRGSGAGSKVAYALNITEVNPDRYDLLFERFMAKGREPDIDTDFADIDAVFKHLQDRYGELSVARVGAYTRFTAKSATQKVLSAYNFDQKEIRKLIDSMPDRLSFTLDEAIKESKYVKEFFSIHPDMEGIIRKFEGIVEHASTHAGGVIICKDLVNILPIIKRADDPTKMIIAMDKKELEALGHYKFDILGLSYLTIMQTFNEFVDINWQAVDFDDPKVYEMLQRGEVTGVFQLADQKDKTMEMKPNCFNDLIAINALIRPGVCDWNEYLSKRFGEEDESELEPYMKDTHGLIIYQEQYLLHAQKYAGWDIAYADKHIRKNKNIKGDTELKEKWLNDTGGMEALWNTICDIVAGGYSFNKSHATSYARLTFMTAYAKCYYPKEFYAAYLTKYNDKPERINEAISELKTMEVPLFHPDINKSETRFIPTEDGILFPINAVKGVGGSALYAIEQLKPIKSLQDFLDRRIKKFVKKTTIEALIKSGAFDFEGKSRYDLLCEWNEDFSSEPEKEEHVYEYESFGYYLQKTPFDRYSIKPWKEVGDQIHTITIGQLTELKIRNDKRGAAMAFGTIINNHDTIDIIVFSSIYAKYPSLEEGQILFLKGKKDGQKLLVNHIEVLEDEY